ncbi:MAG: hypothetical protein QM811_22210 [Pirellulales bacterium]
MLAKITQSNGCNSPSEPNASFVLRTVTCRFSFFKRSTKKSYCPAGTLPSASTYSISSTWPLPRTCVNAVAVLFCASPSNLRSSGVKVAS